MRCLEGSTRKIRNDDTNLMFSNIFRPKWQHRKAEVRIAALKELGADDPILLQLAGSDEAAAVRRYALRRINDLPALVRLLADERDEETRDICAKRLKRLLAGEEECPALAVRQRLVTELGDEDVLAYVLKHASEIELREAALEAVSRQSLLADVALSDPSGELRMTALGRIERPATLERVAKQAKGKDKRVARFARERLEAMYLEAERPERQAAICEAIEALVEQGGVDLIAFDRQQKAWQSMLPAANSGLAQRYDACCEAFAGAQGRFKAEAALTARQRELCEQVEALLQEVGKSRSDLSGTREAVMQLRREWSSLAAELPAPNRALTERFESALGQTERRLAELSMERDRLARLQRVIDVLEAKTTGANAYSAAALAQIESDWQEAGGTQPLPQGAALKARFQQLMSRAGQRLAELGREREQLTKMLAELMDELEAALDEGQLQQASSCHDRLRDRMARLQELGGAPGAALQKRLHKSVVRLREMRDWRRFGTNRARGELLEQMEGLAESKLTPQKLADAIKTLRNEWRHLDRKDGPAGEALWQAFDQAAETAYAPCQAHYDALHQERKTHLEARQHFLDELEQAHIGVDWQAPDWAAVEQRLQQARKSWSKLGGVEARDWQEVNKRYRRLVAQFEEKLAPQRESGVQRREGLITKVERLADEPDIEKALTETRAAQSAWRPVVSALPRIERGLWRRFKAACDAVYARQKEKNQAKRDAEQAERSRLEQLCSELEALASGLDSEGLPQSRSRQADIEQAWREAQPLMRIPKVLMQRHDAALKAFARAKAVIEERQAESEQQLLLERVALCEALEACLFGEGDVESLEASWQVLPELRDTSFEQVLSTRFMHVRQALREGGEALARLTAAAEGNLALGRSVCLQLELLAGVDSPVEFAEERLAMQVEMLPGAMTGHLAGPGRQEEILRLLGEYLAIGPILPQERKAQTARVQAVLQQKQPE
jgi:hypothetical protein